MFLLFFSTLLYASFASTHKQQVAEAEELFIFTLLKS